MAYVKPKYEGEDFLEWYKTHYGKDYDGSALNRGEGMLDQDWEIGSALYGTYKDKLAREEQYNNDKALLEKGYNDAQSVADNTYNTQKESLVGDYNKNQAELLKNYQSSVSGLDKSKNQSLQSASITYDKLKKYLPTQIKAQGLGGLGVSESTMLQAHNNYATQTGSIKNNYNENKTALEEAYGSNKANLDTTHESNMSSLENQKLASDTERKTTLDQSLADLLTYYNSDMQGMKTDVGAITKKFFDQNKELQQNNYQDLAALISGDLKTEDFNTFLTQIENADIDDNQKALLKTLATNQVNKNISTRRSGTFDNFKTTIGNITDLTTDNVFAKIDALDIDDNQKAELKALAESQVGINVYNENVRQGEEGLDKISEAYHSGDYTTAQNLLENYKPYLTQGDYTNWSRDIQTGLDKVAAEEQKKQQEAYDKNVVEGKQYVNCSEKVYSSYSGSAEKSSYAWGKYQITGKADQSVLDSSEFKKALSAIGANGSSASNIKNGTVFQLTTRSGWEWIDDVYNYTFGLILPDGNAVSPDVNEYIYYNGTWYKCKSV